MDNSILFFSCFRTERIKETIFKYLNSNYKSTIKYNNITIANKIKYEIILDKLKSNHFIHFDQSLQYRNLFNSNNNLIYNLSIINKILNHLYLNNNSLFHNLSPLEKSIENSSLYSLKSCISIYNNNNNNQQNRIENSFRIYSLIDQSFYNSNNNFEITKYLIQLYNSHHNSYNNNNSSYMDVDNCSGKDSEELELKFFGDLKKQKQHQFQDLLKYQYSIYNVNNECDLMELIHLDRPITSYSINSILNLISVLTEEKVKLVDLLGLDIKLLLNQFFRKSGSIYIGCIFNKLVIKECINMYLYHPNPVNIILEKAYINDLDHAILSVLRNVYTHPNRNQEQIKQRHSKFIDFIVKNGIPKSLDSLVEIVETYLIIGKKESRCGKTKKESRYIYMGDYYIYHLLLSNKFKDIKITTFRPKSKFNMLLLYSYSIFKFSIPVLELFNQYLDYYGTNIISNRYIIDYNSSDGERTNQQLDFSTLYYYDTSSVEINNGYEVYLDYFSSNILSSLALKDSSTKSTQQYWDNLLKAIIIYQNSNSIQVLLKQNSFLKEYVNNLKSNFWFMFKCHFEYFKSSLSVCKVKLLFKMLKSYHIDHGLSYYQKLLNENKTYIQNQLLEFQDVLLTTQHDEEFQNYQVLEYFISIIFDYISLESVEYSIGAFKFLQEKHSNNNSDSNNSSKYYYNNPNILINNLIRSINLKEIQLVNSILQALSEFKLIEYKPTTYISNSLDFIRELNSLGYFKQFKTSYLISIILNQIESNIISRDFVMELIPTSNAILIKCYDHHFKVLYDISNNRRISNNNKSINSSSNSTTIISDIKMGYYNRALEKLKNQNIDIKLDSLKSSGLNSFSSFDQMSLEWFIKFYPYLKKSFRNGIEDSLSLISKRLDIFDSIWEDYYLDIELLELESFIKKLLLEMKHPQLIEHCFKTKFKFIQIIFNNNSNLIGQLHQLALVNGQIEIFKLLRKVFNFFNFKLETFIKVITFDSFSSCKYHVIQFLEENSFIPNPLKEFIGRENLFNLKIKEFHNYNSSNLNDCRNNSIIVTKSMFILIHNIIKNQKK